MNIQVSRVENGRLTVRTAFVARRNYAPEVTARLNLVGGTTTTPMLGGTTIINNGVELNNEGESAEGESSEDEQ